MSTDSERLVEGSERGPRLAKGLRRNIKADTASLLNDVRFLAAADPTFAAKLTVIGLPRELLGLPEEGTVSESGRRLASLRSKGESGNQGGALKPLRHKIIKATNSLVAQIAYAREIDPSLDEELRERSVDLEAVMANFGTTEAL